ncbi:DUF3991 and TOPRIM domain-containing protein [Bacillus altitudinis]|uniref:DUF3991 and TOPRIM domain-containing protein n=1 Tax=Bacillus TaxID=1386 RepID=UPI000260A9A6|nr:MULTISPECIES: DUF3991 and TOPRIM domain-containing protein [Bacillus]EIL83347.1 hypothetical protein BAME_34110 [Bacillus sp. M 2-6]MEC0473684.1 DUF3991 and TOPRIM domain-containing protein [Bacillus altitudinis]
MAVGKRVSDKEVEKASGVGIVEYLNLIGEPIIADNQKYYRHQDHDSLVINVQKNYFSWNSQGLNGNNAISYLTKVKGFSFPDAVRKINADIEGKDISVFKPKAPSYPLEFEYKVDEVKTTKNITNYLVNERCIAPDIVEMLIESDLIKEDKYKNVVFKWKDSDGELIGANLQGTYEIPLEKRIKPNRAYFKQELPTTKEATYKGFSITIGYPENLFFYEASIDSISYLTLNREKMQNSRLTSMGGLSFETFISNLKTAVQDCEKHGRTIQSINICVDNDEAGRKFVEKVKVFDFEINGRKIPLNIDLPELPKGHEKWDWNNELKAIVTKKKQLSKGIEID